MGKMIELTASDGFKLGAYRADPAGKPKGGVVVMQEIFGANDHIKSVADRAAAAGYLAIAPALFDRAERNVNWGYDAAARNAGVALLGKIQREDTLKDIAAAVAVAKEGGKAGVVGFCWGGTLAWVCSAQLPEVSAAVGYYGGGVPGLNSLEPKAPVMLHFGADDQGIPLTAVKDVEAKHPNVPVYVYPNCGHAFNSDADPHSYNADAAKLAWTRTIEFFGKNLG